MTSSAVILKNVTLTLPSRAGDVEILRGVDLSVKSGEAIGIVGPSGSGKTSLLMLIAGLERATSGTLEVAGTSLKDKDEDALACGNIEVCDVDARRLLVAPAKPQLLDAQQRRAHGLDHQLTLRLPGTSSVADWPLALTT